MKKLMMFAGAVVASLSVSAASVEWQSGTITLQNGDPAGKGAVTAYLFELTQAQYDALSADKVYDTYKDSLGTADATKSSTAKGAANLQGKTDTYGSGDTAYAAILYVSSDGSYAIGNLASYTFTSSMDATVGDLSTKLGGDQGTGAAVSWASTTGGGGTDPLPEPTSGLLLLVGGAILALRRKQK